MHGESRSRRTSIDLDIVRRTVDLSTHAVDTLGYLYAVSALTVVGGNVFAVGQEQAMMNHYLFKLSSDGSTHTQFFTQNFSGNETLTTDGSNIYVGDSEHLWKVDPSGTGTQIFGADQQSGVLLGPSPVAGVNAIGGLSYADGYGLLLTDLSEDSVLRYK